MGIANPNEQPLQFVQATPEQRATIERCLDEHGQRPDASASPELWSGGTKLMGILFVFGAGAPAVAGTPRNLLRKAGSSWKVVFNGAREFFIKISGLKPRPSGRLWFVVTGRRV